MYVIKKVVYQSFLCLLNALRIFDRLNEIQVDISALENNRHVKLRSFNAHQIALHLLDRRIVGI